MKSALLITVALGTVDCTQFSNHLFTAKDSTISNALVKEDGTAPVVSDTHAIIHTSPELPLLKDVLDSKTLFW